MLGFTFRIMGDMKGWVLVAVSERDAQSILGLLWPGNEPPASEEMIVSGLGEAAHIVSGAFVSAMANMMGMVAFQSTPRLKRGHTRRWSLILLARLANPILFS